VLLAVLATGAQAALSPTSLSISRTRRVFLLWRSASMPFRRFGALSLASRRCSGCLDAMVLMAEAAAAFGKRCQSGRRVNRWWPV